MLYIHFIWTPGLFLYLSIICLLLLYIYQIVSTITSIMSKSITYQRNVNLVDKFAPLLKLYKRRRTFILRCCYILLVLVSFNSGGSRKRHPQNKKIVKKDQVETGVDGKPVKRSILDKLNVFKLVNSKFNKIRRSDLITFLSTLDLKDPKTHPILYYLLSQISLLIIRAILTLKVASLDGLIVSSLISRNFKRFFKNIAIWLVLGVPASMTNSLLTYSEKNLSKYLRLNFTNILLDQYLPDNGNSTLYQLINKTKTSEIANSSEESTSIEDPNQRITTLIELFSKSLATLTPQLLKPSLDIFLCANQLSSTEGNTAEGVVSLGLITHLSTFVLKMFTPNFTKLSLRNNELENKFHMYHSKIVQDNEEIALSKGHRREIDMIDLHYFELETFKRSELRRMAIYDFMMNFIVKYVWGASGLLLCAVPIFSTAYSLDFKLSNVELNHISADFITNRRLLLSGSSAVGKLIQSKKNIQNLVGYSSKLSEFYNILKDINDSQIEDVSDNDDAGSHKLIVDGGNLIHRPLVSGPNIEYGDEITFQNIPLITPSQTTLVADLSFSIKPGNNLLIIGPNGCGKSSLFRILGGLWPVLSPGKLVIPGDKNDLFYLPQRSYIMIGSLKEQIIYPDSIDEYNEKRLNDDYLIDLLNIVKLGHLVDDCEDIIQERLENLQFGKKKISNKISGSGDGNEIDYEIPDSPLDLNRKWPDLLSVGEQQRVALARLYYHRPKFAVLDECTSSISSELEEECYRYAIESLQITVISVCHRSSLWKFHNSILKFDGEGNVKFNRFDPVKRLARQDELVKIENQLKNSNGTIDDLKNKIRDLENLKNRNLINGFKNMNGSSSSGGGTKKLLYIE